MSKILMLILVVIALILGVAILAQPNEFRIERSISISASPSKVFSHVNDLHNWEAWSPWVKLDPSAKSSFEGPASGTGAIMRWAGNNKVGEGSMTITESRKNELVKFKLEFLKPFKATNGAEFTFKPEGKQTVVTWAMFGQNNFVSKAMSLFMNCDKMVGGEFEKGLADLKSVSEKSR